MPKKRKQYRPNQVQRYALALLFLCCLGSGAFWIHHWWQERSKGFRHYAGFGIPLPVGFEIHGIDVSHHQDLIRWDRVREMEDGSVRIGFAFIKASEGYSRVDPQFRRNWRKAREAGMLRGAYHFFLPHKNGLIQAENFIATVKLESGDLPPVLDIEETFKVKNIEIRKRALEWLRRIESHYGVKPIVYTNTDFYKNVLDSTFDAYPLWIAHYLQPKKPRIERDWQFWQHSETGLVNGIVTRVDFNVFNGDSSGLKRMLIP